MILDDIPLSAIDFENEIFRITEDLNFPPMIASIEAIGQQNPVLLLEGLSSRRIIVCGFRRLHALRQMGATHALARVISVAECNPDQAYRIALSDNLSHRPLNALEKARTLCGLKRVCAIADDILVKTYLPMLELEPNSRILRQYLSIMDLPLQLRVLYGEGSLTLASAERIALLPPKVQNDLGRFFNHARFSSSLQRKIFDLLEDVTAMAGVSLTEILNRPEITFVLEAQGLSQFQKGEKIFELLHKWRNPRLSLAEEKFSADRKRLGLPGSIRLSHDPFFENRQLKVEFTVSSARQFREAADELQRAARESVLDDLMRMS
jgi:hypothetical protein